MSEEAPLGSLTKVVAFGQTDPGRVRTNNEDTFLISKLSGPASATTPFKATSLDASDGAVLLAVSDGMGGAAAGEVASALVIETLRNAMSEAAETEGLSLDEATLHAVKSANMEVWTAARDPGRRGMGATLTAVCIHQQQAYIAAVGDSRAYLCRGDRIRQMTRDQSFVQFMIDSGAIKPEAAARLPMKNLVLQAMGQKPEVEVALGRLELRQGDVLLLCSDGLSNKLEADDMRTIIMTAPTLAAACNEMIELANTRGGEDNVTVVLARIEGEALMIPLEGESMTTTFRVLAEYRGELASDSAAAPPKEEPEEEQIIVPKPLLAKNPSEPPAEPSRASTAPSTPTAPTAAAPPRLPWFVWAALVAFIVIFSAFALRR